MTDVMSVVGGIVLSKGKVPQAIVRGIEDRL
jgi:hypothetical protein